MHYLEFDSEMPTKEEAEEIEDMKYYQWMPFILLFQALLFNVPSLVWHGMNQKAGIDADHILLSANRLELSTAAKENDMDIVDKKRNQYKKMITRQLGRFLGATKKRRDVKGAQASGKKAEKVRAKCQLSGYLVFLFMFSKVLYLGNIFFQFFFVSKVLGINYLNYGFEIMKGMWAEHDWEGSHDVAFPRVAFCDLEVRRLGNTHRYSTQCTLLLNMFNEKVYIGLWFWFIMLGVANVLGIVVWILRIGIHHDRVLFLRNHLRADKRVSRPTSKRDRYRIEKFSDYLQQDGIFLLRLISANTNAIVTTEVTGAVWEDWMDRAYDKNEEPETFDDERDSLTHNV